jgi:hypothetical protein
MQGDGAGADGGNLPVYRFLVTRIGFLRSVKKMVELSKHHFTVVDPSTGERKECIKYEDIDEIQLPSASSYSFSSTIQGPLAVDPESQEQEERFTVVTPTSKETYSCFRRMRFLSCYFELREEHLQPYRTFSGGGHTNGLVRANNAALSLFCIPRAEKWCSRGQCRAPTRLVVRATCLDEEACDTNGDAPVLMHSHGEELTERVGTSPTLFEKQRIWFIDIVKIQRIVDDPSTIVLYMSDGSVKRYWTMSGDILGGVPASSSSSVPTSNGTALNTATSTDLAAAIVSNAKQCLNMQIHAETSDGPWEYNALTATLDDIVVPVVFEMPVLFEDAASVGVHADYKNRRSAPWKSAHAPTPILLALTATAILERDPTTKRTISSSQLSDVFSIVRDRQSDNVLVVELFNGMNRRYRCVSCVIVERSQDVGIGFGPLTPTFDTSSNLTVSHSYEMLHKFQASAGVGNRIHASQMQGSPVSSLPVVDVGYGPDQCRVGGSIEEPNTPVVGSMQTLPASCARDVLVSNILDQALLSKRRIPLYFRETGSAIKVGGRSGPTSQIAEYQELLLKRLCAFSKESAMTTTLEDLLFEIVVNIPISGFNHNNRAAVRQMFTIIAASHNQRVFPEVILTLALQALRRLLFSRNGFEEVSRHENSEGLVAVVNHLQGHQDDCIAYECASLLKCMVSQAGLDQQSKALNRTSRQEELNRKALFLNSDTLLTSLIKCAVEGRQPDKAPGAAAAHLLSPSSSTDASSNSASNGRLHLGVAAECRDALVTSPLLQMLEMTLSTKKNSDAKVKIALMSALDIQNPNNQKQLFALCRSASFPIARASTLLLKTHVLEESPQLMLQLQDHCRESGILLWHLYLSIDSASPIQRHCSSQLVALLVHENPRSSEVIRMCFPAPLIADLKPDQLVYSEFGDLVERKLEEVGVGGGRANTAATNRVVQNNSLDEAMLAALASPIPVEALPEISTVAMPLDSETGLLLGSPEDEDAASLRSSISSANPAPRDSDIDTSDLPPGGPTSREDLGESDDSTSPQHEDVPPQTPAAAHREQLEHISLPVRQSSVSSITAPQLITSSDHFLYLGRAAECVVLKPDFFHRVATTFLQPDMIWNHDTRKELCARLLREISALDVDLATLCEQQQLQQLREKERSAMSGTNGMGENENEPSAPFEQSQIKWNDSDFVVHYTCLASEVKVGRYYLRLLQTQQQDAFKGKDAGSGGGNNNTMVLSINDIELDYADDFLQLLHLRMSIESTMETVRLCLITAVGLFRRHSTNLRSQPFLTHLMCMCGRARNTADSARVTLSQQPRTPAPAAGGGDFECDDVDDAAAISGGGGMPGTGHPNSWGLYERGLAVQLCGEMIKCNRSNMRRFLGYNSGTENVIALLADALEHISRSGGSSGGPFVGGLEPPTPMNHRETPYMYPTTPGPNHKRRDQTSVILNSALQVADICVQVLINAVQVHHDGSPNIIIRPTPDIKVKLCQPKMLRVVVGAVATAEKYPRLARHTVLLLHLLTRRNSDAIPQLLEEGLHLHVLLHGFESDGRFSVSAAQLLRTLLLADAASGGGSGAVTAAQQLEPELLASLQSSAHMRGAPKMSLGSDVIHSICAKSPIVGLIPEPILALLIREGPNEFAHVMANGAESPGAIWNSRMKIELQQTLRELIQVGSKAQVPINPCTCAPKVLYLKPLIHNAGQQKQNNGGQYFCPCRCQRR